MLVGRRTWDVGAKMSAEDRGSPDYPFSGPLFLPSHRPLDPPDQGVSVLERSTQACSGAREAHPKGR
jgi:hypothetical protein